jgi:hypothetical protein
MLEKEINWNMLALDVAFRQRIFQLQGRDAVLTFLLGQRLGARHVPGGRVG